MKNLRVIQRKISIFSICFAILLCVAAHSFAGEEEKSVFIGNEILSNKIVQSPAQLAADGEPSISIHLSAAHFDPLRILPMRQERLNDIEMYDAGQVGYYIVQFDGPIEKAWKNSLEEAGAEIFDYVPDFAFIIRINSDDVPSVGSLPHVRWLGIYQPSYRVSQAALDKMSTKTEEVKEQPTNQVEFRVTVFPGESPARLKTEIAVLGGTIVDMVETKWKTSFIISISPDIITQVTAISGVKWVEPIPKWKLFNNVSTDVMNVRTPRDSHGLYGTGQTIGVCDTGLDEGLILSANLHDDFEDGAGVSRVTAIFDLAGDGANDVRSGHGTHVAGSVLGNGLLSGSSPLTGTFPATSFAGTAPKANLVFQASENNTTGAIVLPTDLNDLFSQSEGEGADLHTNSWGSSVGGMYTSSSEDVDEYMWSNPEFLILFAASNDGIDKDGDGVVDLYSLGSPATAKNCLTVGASEGNRPSGAGYDFAWGTGSWADKYPVIPVSTDHVSDNVGGMAAFSSRGPTLDGRYKPDIVAPGTNILSTKSSATTETGWGIYSNDYTWMGGTSMATPLTAGAAALMREYLINAKGFANPSAAMIKAAMLNGAEAISPGQYGTGATQEIPDSPVPNNVTGWGRVNIGNSVYPTAPFNRFYFDEQSSLNTGEHKDFTINVSSSNSPLKVNLVWTDYPGTPAAQGALVNDLDLQVTNPSSTVLYPDHASQKSTVSQIAYDSGSAQYGNRHNGWAIQFTPSTYPVNLESVSLYFINPWDSQTQSASTSDVDIVVYDDNGTGGLPGTELFRKTMGFVPTGWITLGISGVSIGSGNFYVAMEKGDAVVQGMVIDIGNPSGRSYYYDYIAGEWVVASAAEATPYIRANVRGADHSTAFDRVNNAVGLTLNNPATGTYTIRVSGYNVPQGPQPYALVISCEECSVGGKEQLPLTPIYLLLLGDPPTI